MIDSQEQKTALEQWQLDGNSAEAYERYLVPPLLFAPGAEAGVMMGSPFSSLGTDDLRGLLTEAGFREATITIGIDPVRYPPAEEFLRQEAASSPLAGPVVSLDEEKHRAMIEDLENALQLHMDNNGIVFPLCTHLARAHP